MELVNEEGPANVLRARRNAPKRPLGTKRTEQKHVSKQQEIQTQASAWVPPGRDPNNIVFIKADSDAIYHIQNAI